MNDTHRIQLELRFDGTAPTGHVCREGGEPRVFSGWVGLVCAVEAAVADEVTMNESTRGPGPFRPQVHS
jgi:hypothetical protein